MILSALVEITIKQPELLKDQKDKIGLQISVGKAQFMTKSGQLLRK